VPRKTDSPNIPIKHPAPSIEQAALPPKAAPISEVKASCRATLNEYWTEVRAKAEAGEIQDYLEDIDLRQAISYSLNCREKAYHYVLLTQLLAKADDPKRDCRALQEQAPVEGAFDARSIAHEVSVDFERRELDGALGSSPSPYLINSVRTPLLDANDPKRRKDTEGWRRVCQVASEVEIRQSPNFTASVFRQVLLEIYRKLGASRIKYDVPLRASLAQTLHAIRSFTAAKSGGDRPLAVTAALFETIGNRTSLFDPAIRRGKINASDESSGQVADIECVNAKGDPVLAIEVKDKTVTVSDLEEKLPATRKRGVKEVFFVSAHEKKEAEGVAKRVAKEFGAGQNLYVCGLFEIAECFLAVTGESPRRDFLIRVGEQLDKYSDTRHRLAWKKALDELSNN